VPDLFEVVRSQRAHRRFTDDPVPDAVVEQVLEAATFAPSAENRQPWVFVVVREPARRARIGDLVRRAWEGGARDHSAGRLPAAMLADVDEGATGGLAGAPVVVVVGADTGDVHPRALEASIFPAVQNLLLAASALGLGSALMTLPLAFPGELAEIVGLPEQVRPVAVVPLGVPARRLGPPRRQPVSAKAHREHYGAGW
jgi:nitroreductase